MKYFAGFLATLFGLATAIAPADASYITKKSPQVNLGYAKYQGTALPIGVDQYLGMRYAAPPLGDLRFRAPKDPLQERGTIKAGKHGNVCLAVADSGPPVPTGEDCLFIDVYAPSSAKPDSKLPVMVWFQGGALVELVNPNYNGTHLVKASDDNAIIVSFNYRVGPYGFLASEEVKKDGDLNVGFLDQRKALEWVSKHIAAFGGDSDKVTIFGTSVGTVLFQMLAYGGKETSLFRAGISASMFLPTVHTLPELEFQYQQLLTATNCSTLFCLRSLPTSVLQHANTYRPYPGQTQRPLFPYGPVIDNTFLESHPTALLVAGKFVKKPLIAGTSRTEGTIFAPPANTTSDLSSFLLAQFPSLTPADLDAINAEYADIPANYTPPGVTASKAPLFYRAAAAYGNAQYSCSAYAAAKAFAAAGVPVYFFRNDIRDPVEVEAGIVVPHTWETIAVWGPGGGNVNYGGLPAADGYEGVNKGIVGVVQGYWTSFARSGGDPNVFRAEGAAVWEGFEGSGELRLETNRTGMEGVGRLEERCRFWRRLDGRTGL
ncbi:MAG: hypothetical protein MMC23_002399 [Stictis urceolatum]|nr:hypothetical protein [Stictis urceolata]